MQKYVLLIDCQNDFITGSLANPDAQKKVPEIVKYIKEQPKGTIFFYTLDTHDENYLNTLEGQKLPVKHCIRDTQGWYVAPSITAVLKEKISQGDKVQAITKDTFGSIPLMEYFKDLKDKDIEVHAVGFCTDICVLSNMTLLRAAKPNMKITCHANLCSGVTKESHDAAITVMKSCQIDVEGE